MLRLILYGLLLLLILRVIWRFLGGLIDGVADRRPGARAADLDRGEPLVKDPVCGTFVVKQRALTASAGGETFWFCSERCRDEWRASRARTRPA